MESSSSKIIRNGPTGSKLCGARKVDTHKILKTTLQFLTFMDSQFTTLVKDSRHTATLVKDSRHTSLLLSRSIQGTLVYYLSEGFKAHWFTTFVKYSRHTGLLP